MLYFLGRDWRKIVTGTAAISFSFSETPSGTVENVSHLSSTFNFSESASGIVDNITSANPTFTMIASPSGFTEATGNSAIQFSLTVVGESIISASGQCNFAFDLHASGFVEVIGTGQVTFSFAVHASGTANKESTLPCPYIPARVDQSSETTNQPAMPASLISAVDTSFESQWRADRAPCQISRSEQYSATIANSDEKTSTAARLDEEACYFGKIDEQGQVVNLPVDTSESSSRGDNSFEFSNRSAENDIVSSGRTDECR